MAFSQTAFNEIEHGFRFAPPGEVHLGVGYPLPGGGELNLDQLAPDLSLGMCYAALDRFQGLAVPSAGADVPDGAALTYFASRQLEALPPATALRLMAGGLADDRELYQGVSRRELPKLRRRLAAGRPAVLALILVEGNRFVVASGYESDRETHTTRLRVYDPTRPGMPAEINVGRLPQGMTLRQGDEVRVLRGFLVMEYHQPPQPVLTRRAGPMLGGLAISLRWPVDSHRVNQFFGENPESYRPFGLAGHEGLDLFALSGANVYAAAGGVVTQASHPEGHPYGLQVRIRHEAQGVVFHTIYAHLSEVFVRADQTVVAGERIGLADNTGNSFGSHLHLTLKIEGQQTPGYPAGIVDPWPYLQDSPPVEPVENLPLPSGVSVFTTVELNLRAAPGTGAEIRALLPAGERLMTLGEAPEVRGKIGQEGAWLAVQTASGKAGFVAARYVQNLDQSLPPGDLVVYPVGSVNLRAGPSQSFEVLATLGSMDPLGVLGESALMLARVGKPAEWLPVQTENGLRGWVAAWLVHRTGQWLPASGLVVYPAGAVNLRARPALDANVLTVLTSGDALEVLEEADTARRKIGQAGEWVNVRSAQGFSGYVAAWLLQTTRPAVPLQPGEGLTLFATADLNLRAQASLQSPRVGGVFRAQPLKVVEADPAAARLKAGQPGQWVYGEAPDGTRGWAAAWFLSLAPL